MEHRSSQALTVVQHRTATQILWIIGYAAATAIAARVEIPHQPVPYTLQTLVVLLSGAYLGAVNGAISQFAYLTMGLLGAPVFAGGAMGAAYLLGPTGGYLLAFPVAAWLTGALLRERKSLLLSFGVMLLADLLIFGFGTIQLYATTLHDWSQSVSAGFFAFSWWDAAKVGTAAVLYSGITWKARADGTGTSSR